MTFDRSESMTWDRFDICEAWYMFAVLWHGGMGSPEYQIFTRLHRMQFKPSPLLTEATLSKNGREIYDRLVSVVSS